MKHKKSKETPLKVSYEYEPTPDAEERIAGMYEFLLSDKNKVIIGSDDTKMAHF